jgi:hypothetical protein
LPKKKIWYRAVTAAARKKPIRIMFSKSLPCFQFDYCEVQPIQICLAITEFYNETKADCQIEMITCQCPGQAALYK